MSAQEASKRRHPSVWVAAQRGLRMAGRCGSHDGNGYLCTRPENHTGPHRQVKIGGVDDGLVEMEWHW